MPDKKEKMSKEMRYIQDKIIDMVKKLLDKNVKFGFYLYLTDESGEYESTNFKDGYLCDLFGEKLARLTAEKIAKALLEKHTKH